MRKIAVLQLFCFAITASYAQLAKGDRVLAWQIDMAQNSNYDSALAYAQTACLESIHLFYTWSGIEPSAGTFDASFINRTLDVANIYYPAYGIKAELQIAPINTNVKETPDDLRSVNFDDPAMISRFKTVLDTIFKHIPDLELTALNIGNEGDIFMGTDIDKYTAYKTFLDSVVPYAKELYQRIHQTELNVGTTFTFDGVTSASKSELCKTVNNGLDVVTVTYYPLESDFTMKSPSVVHDDFSALVHAYPDMQQPIYFAECGYASSEICNSSEAQQAQFYQNVFSAWDTYYDNIKYITIFKSTDWSSAEVSNFGVYYGLHDTVFLEYLRTLGVRSWDNDGTNKRAYETILCELNARDWCNVHCVQSGVESPTANTSAITYPDPTTGQLSVTAERDIRQIKIYNSSGKLCRVSSEKDFGISQLPDGIYIVIVEFENGAVEIKKLRK